MQNFMFLLYSFDCIFKVVVKCSQTGEQHNDKFKNLTKEDNQPILNNDYI